MSPSSLVITGSALDPLLNALGLYRPRPTALESARGIAATVTATDVDETKRAGLGRSLPH
jgi:hypothetical protein